MAAVRLPRLADPHVHRPRGQRHRQARGRIDLRSIRRPHGQHDRRVRRRRNDAAVGVADRAGLGSRRGPFVPGQGPGRRRWRPVVHRRHQPQPRPGHVVIGRGAACYRVGRRGPGRRRIRRGGFQPPARYGSPWRRAVSGRFRKPHHSARRSGRRAGRDHRWHRRAGLRARRPAFRRNRGPEFAVGPGVSRRRVVHRHGRDPPALVIGPGVGNSWPLRWQRP